MHQEPEQSQRGLVGTMEVIEDEHERPPVGRVSQKRRDAVEQPEPLLLGIQPPRCRQSRHELADLRDGSARYRPLPDPSPPPRPPDRCRARRSGSPVSKATGQARPPRRSNAPRGPALRVGAHTWRTRRSGGSCRSRPHRPAASVGPVPTDASSSPARSSRCSRSRPTKTPLSSRSSGLSCLERSPIGGAGRR